MNINHPHKHPAEIQPPGDAFGDALLIGLSRQIYFKLARGPLRTLITSLLSFGVAPILMWRWQFKRYVAFEQQQLWHLAKWMNQHAVDIASPAQLQALSESARERVPDFEFRLLSNLCMAFLAIIFFTQLFPFQHHYVRVILDCTYLFPLRATQSRMPFIPLALATKLYLIWNLCIGGAALCHLGKVYQHQKILQEFVDRFGIVSATAPARNVSIDLRGQWRWIILGLIFAALSAIWLLPVMLAAAAHYRLMRVLSLVHRSEMALQFHSLRKQLQPGMEIKLPVYLRSWCANEKCGAPLEEGETACPRCNCAAQLPLYVRIEGA